MTTPVLLDQRDTEKMGVIITLKRNLLISADSYQHIANCDTCISSFANVILHARDQKKLIPDETREKIVKMMKPKPKRKAKAKVKKKKVNLNQQPLGRQSVFEDKKWIKSRADTLGLDKKGSIAFALKNTDWSYRHIAGLLGTNTNRVWEINTKEKIRRK